MEIKHKLQRVLGVTCFTLGLLVGMFLIATAVWSDLEANFYGFGRFYAEPLNSLSCPVYLDRDEAGSMSVRLSNATDREQQRTVLIRLSSRLTFIEKKVDVAVPPGQQKRVYWGVSNENLDMGSFVFAHVTTYPANQAPMQEAMCGVFVLDTPFNIKGQYFYFFLVAVSVVLLGIGLWLWDTSRIPAISTQLPQVRMAMYFLVVVVLLGVITSYLGVWMAGVLALLLIVVTMISILYLLSSM